MSKHYLRYIWVICFFIGACTPTTQHNAPMKQNEPLSKEEIYQSYINFFEEVYQTMVKNYYKDIPREDFDAFIERFKTNIYPQLSDTGKSNDYIRWRSAAFLVEQLKSKEDIFSAFYPPKPAQDYKEEVLGQRVDLGVVGKATDQGYQTTQVEPRSDAYEKGMRIGDVVVAIGERDIKGLKQEEVDELLTPLIDTKVNVRYLTKDAHEKKNIEVVSREYFKQTVFDVPTGKPLLYCLKVERFNRKTAEDMLRFMQFYKTFGPMKGLILDLRGNPGGPPLAAREMSSFFLKGGDEFAYFQKKGQPKAELDVPQIPEEFKYEGPLVILIDEKSGSASELFSGIMQRQKRAVLMGRNSAGQVFLKSMFNFSDNSMVLLVTERGHYPDGGVFSFSGLVPDRHERDMNNDDVFDYAIKYLIYMNQKNM